MDEERIVLAHGGGGALTRELIAELIAPALEIGERALTDAAEVHEAPDLLFTTDAFVVKPLFFRGGDIGSLSVHGTVNDLAVSGARPLALSLALILEEGLDMALLRRIVAAAAKAARRCAVRIITGDTKVVARGEADGVFITTAGIGRRALDVGAHRIREGDRVLINGPIGDHGLAVLSERKGVGFGTNIESDSAPVWPFVWAMHEAGIDVHAMRDPTRGGVAACCVELADEAAVTIALEEEAIPVRRETAAACAILGLDPLTIANEGKLVAFVPAHETGAALEVLRATPGGERAAAIGTVRARRSASCLLRTRFGGERLVEMPYGEELPRIC